MRVSVIGNGPFATLTFVISLHRRIYTKRVVGELIFVVAALGRQIQNSFAARMHLCMYLYVSGSPRRVRRIQTMVQTLLCSHGTRCKEVPWRPGWPCTLHLKYFENTDLTVGAQHQQQDTRRDATRRASNRERERQQRTTPYVRGVNSDWYITRYGPNDERAHNDFVLLVVVVVLLFLFSRSCCSRVRQTTSAVLRVCARDNTAPNTQSIRSGHEGSCVY